MTNKSFVPFYLASLLPLLCGACSWVQALQDNFRMSFGNAPAQPLALSVTEVQVRMVYPHGIDNVGSAVSYMLEPHAYRPAYRDASGKFIAQRRFINNFGAEPLPLSRAMERLVGRDAQVMLDQDRKLYAFRLRNPGEPGVAFADLGAAPPAVAAIPGVTGAARPTGLCPGRGGHGNSPANRARCRSGTLRRAPGKHCSMPACRIRKLRNEIHFPVKILDFCRSVPVQEPRPCCPQSYESTFWGVVLTRFFWRLGEPGQVCRLPAVAGYRRSSCPNATWT